MNWQDEFIQLYTSTNLENMRKAFDLKRKHIPSKLYRYREVSKETLQYRKQEISNGELFLSHPKNLNDPFECWSILHSISPEEYVDKNMYAEYYSMAGKNRELNTILENDDWFSALITLQTSEARSVEEANKAKQEIKSNIMFAMEDINKEIRKRIIDMVRFACFSTSATNLPMWYHYTNKRTGICLEYSTDNITDIYQCDSLFPVKYVDQLPDMTYMLAHRENPILAMPVFMTIHKLKDWAYENEWRMIYDAGYWTRKGQPLPNGFEESGVIIKFIKPSKVILGTDIDPELEKEITFCAKEQNIKVVKAKLTEYGLSVD